MTWAMWALIICVGGYGQSCVNAGYWATEVMCENAGDRVKYGRAICAPVQFPLGREAITSSFNVNRPLHPGATPIEEFK